MATTPTPQHTTGDGSPVNDPNAEYVFHGLPESVWIVILCAVVGILGWLFGVIGGLFGFGSMMALFLFWKDHSAEKAQEAERNRLQHEGRLRSELLARQLEEREKQRRREEEAERQRIETERQRKQTEETAARAKWKAYHESKTMADIAKMSGMEFEEFLARLFARMGYTNVTLTPINDQGGDLLCTSPRCESIVVQAKRWSANVGNSAVQELLGAMLHYRRDRGMVVTNNGFTAPARELAAKDPRITLLDGRWLAEQIKTFLPPVTPEFSWEEYHKLLRDGKLESAVVRNGEVTSRCPACGAPMRSIKSRLGRGYFLGCTRYPKCKGKGGVSETSQRVIDSHREQEGKSHETQEIVQDKATGVANDDQLINDVCQALESLGYNSVEARNRVDRLLVSGVRFGSVREAILVMYTNKA